MVFLGMFVVIPEPLIAFCPSMLAHRCLRKASPVMLSGPLCCAHSPRPWGSLSCRPKWTVTSTALSRYVSVCEGWRLGAGAYLILPMGW